MKYIWYKNKVAGPIPDAELDRMIHMFKTMVDNNMLPKDFPDTPPMSKGMQEFPDSVHIFCRAEDL